MKTKIELTKFNGKFLTSYNSTLSIDTDGNVDLALYKVSLINRSKIFRLKKEAQQLYENFTNPNLYNRSLFESFCKKYPEINWEVIFFVKSGSKDEFTVNCDYPITIKQLQEKIREFLNIPADKFYICDSLGYYSNFLDKKILEYKIKRANINVGENAVILTNGKYLVSNYKDTHDLKFVVLPTLAEFLNFSDNEELEKGINTIWEDTPKFMYGNYKQSKKGTPLFYPCAKSNAKHLLIKMRTETKDIHDPKFPIKDCIFYEFNDSYLFIIIPKDTKIEYDEESI